MKTIRISDGLVMNFKMLLSNQGNVVNYYGPKNPGEFDTEWLKVFNSLQSSPAINRSGTNLVS